MERGSRRQSYTQWDDQRSQARMGVAYLVGTLGVGIVIALALFLAMKTDSMERVQTALHGVGLPSLPSLPSLPQTDVEDVFQGLTHQVRKTGESATTLWQRGSVDVGQVNRGSHPGGAGRRD